MWMGSDFTRGGWQESIDFYCCCLMEKWIVTLEIQLICIVVESYEDKKKHYPTLITQFLVIQTNVGQFLFL